jgi:hypothetical protein
VGVFLALVAHVRSECRHGSGGGGRGGRGGQTRLEGEGRGRGGASAHDSLVEIPKSPFQVALYSKYTKELTFENLCRRLLSWVLSRLTDVCLRQTSVAEALGRGGGVGAEALGALLSDGRHMFSKVLDIVTLYGKCTAALTFENCCSRGALRWGGSVRAMLARGGVAFRTLQASLARLGGGGGEGSHLSRGAVERLESQFAMISAVVEAQKKRAGC